MIAKAHVGSDKGPKWLGGVGNAWKVFGEFIHRS